MPIETGKEDILGLHQDALLDRLDSNKMLVKYILLYRISVLHNGLALCGGYEQENQKNKWASQQKQFALFHIVSYFSKVIMHYDQVYLLSRRVFVVSALIGTQPGLKLSKALIFVGSAAMKLWKTGWLVLVFGMVLSGMVPRQASLIAPLQAQPPLARPLSLEDALKKARVNGKYAMLLAQIEVPVDRADYGDFKDHGYWTTPAWRGYTNLPAGYWVYVAPYWYIWRDVARPRPRGPEQATGEPNTPQLGQFSTAWASREADNQSEWLIAEFATPVVASAVKVCESHNPGAINKITAFGLDGKEVQIWAGEAAPLAATAVVVNQKEFPRPLKTNRVKIYLDSPRVPGWNEIDAIGLIELGGAVQWASAVACSSTYSEQNDAHEANRARQLPDGHLLFEGFILAEPNKHILK